MSTHTQKKGEYMKIDYKNKRMEVSFAYDQTLVEIIKSVVDTKKYDRVHNVWVIGLTDLTDLLIPYLKAHDVPYYYTESYKEFFGGKIK